MRWLTIRVRLEPIAVKKSPSASSVSESFTLHAISFDIIALNSSRSVSLYSHNFLLNIQTLYAICLCGCAVDKQPTKNLYIKRRYNLASKGQK